jgi:hypothetical protein
VQRLLHDRSSRSIAGALAEVAEVELVVVPYRLASIPRPGAARPDDDSSVGPAPGVEMLAPLGGATRVITR